MLANPNKESFPPLRFYRWLDSVTRQRRPRAKFFVAEQEWCLAGRCTDAGAARRQPGAAPRVRSTSIATTRAVAFGAASSFQSRRLYLSENYRLSLLAFWQISENNCSLQDVSRSQEMHIQYNRQLSEKRVLSLLISCRKVPEGVAL